MRYRVIELLAGSVCCHLVFDDFADGSVGFVDGWFLAGFDSYRPFFFVDERVVASA